jgi:raffinose/stachyose/melibiose transport system substrate-binding protein
MSIWYNGRNQYSKITKNNLFDILNIQNNLFGGSDFMKRVLKLLSIFLAATCVMGSLGACSSTTKNTSGSSAAPKDVELKVFMTFPNYQTQIEKYFEQFKVKEKAEKNINVDIKLEMPNSDSAAQILKARLSSNDAPDLFTIQANSDIPSYYKAGYLSDLSNQPFVSTLYDSVKKSVTYDGKVVALPIESVEWGYLYNKQLFKEAGVTPPQTLDEMKTVIQKLKAKNITPFLLSFQESWIVQLITALSLGGVVTSEDPTWVSKMNNGTGSYNEVKDIFSVIDLIMENGTAKPFEVSGQTGCADFAHGKAAMWVQGAWEAESILKVNPNLQLGCAPLPVSNDQKGTLINFSTTTSMVVSSTTKQKEAAFDLLNYMLNKKDSSTLFQKLKFNPVATFMTYETYSWTKEASDYVSKGRAYQDLSLPNSVTTEQAKDLQSYYNKTMTKEQVIQDLDKTYKTAVKSTS